MRAFSFLSSVAVSGFLTLAAPLIAAENPVVVELYTSQGCSSCPPADKMLHKLAAREDVIALALHVDYWDYIGWVDEFADPAHTERQRTYAVVGGRRSVYTPQMIVNGVDSIVGAKGMELADAIQAHQGRDTGVAVALARTGDTLQITGECETDPAPMVVHLLRYTPEREARITRGENAGKTLRYANVVQDWRVVGEWDGSKPLSMDVDIAGDKPVVVLIQAAGQGPILAAAQLR